MNISYAAVSTEQTFVPSKNTVMIMTEKGQAPATSKFTNSIIKKHQDRANTAKTIKTSKAYRELDRSTKNLMGRAVLGVRES
jgi:hypothetical protein